MKDKDKEKEKDAEKETSGKLKKKAPGKKNRESKRGSKIDGEDEPAPKGNAAEDDESPADEELDEEAEAEEEEEEEVEEAPPAKVGKSKRPGKAVATPAEKNGGDPGKPATRLAMIRARHESMKREIDQIREDLDSDEEE